MELVNLEDFKGQMVCRNTEFRHLVKKHNLFEIRLKELGRLPHPSTAEQDEELRLKRSKLQIKDRLERILRNYS